MKARAKNKVVREKDQLFIQDIQISSNDLLALLNS